MDNSKTLRRAGILLAYPMAYLYIRLIINFYHGDLIANAFALAVFSAVFILVNEIMRISHGKKLTKPAAFWYLTLVMTSASAPFGPSYALSLLAMHLCAVYCVLVSGDTLLEGRTGGLIPADLFYGFFIKPIEGISRLPDEIGSMKGRKKSVGTLILSVAFAGIMFVLLIVSLLLLSSLDDSFNDLIVLISGFIEDLEIGDVIGRMIWAVPVFFYLYSLMLASSGSDSTRERSAGRTIRRILEKLRNVPSIFVNICASVFVCIYVLFFAFRGAYYFGAFAGSVPEDMLVSEYARSGFFELVWIMIINMVVCLVSGMFERDDRGNLFSKITSTVIMSESLIFAASSLSKLILYYSIYGYTDKRMLAIWGTLVLAAVSVLEIRVAWRGRDHFREGVIITAVSYFIMCVAAGILRQF